MEGVKQGSILGGTLLITGSCIGAGMLALPILTGMAGFFPTMVMFIVAWLFMTTTAFLLIEVNNWFNEPVNLLTMVGKTLGKTGQVISWFLYLFLFYALLVAYISASGNHVSGLFLNKVPQWSASLFFVILFGWFVYLGTRPVDMVNRWLMFGKIVAYILLVIFGFQYFQPAKIFYTDIKFIFFAIPVLIISFGFHNMIPTLFNYLGGDVVRMKKAILYGSLFTLGIYLVWEVMALGILPPEVIHNSFLNDIDAAQAIRNFVGKSAVSTFAQTLAFFAILTSFLAQSLSLVHFIGDGLKSKKRESVFLCSLALLPPLAFALIKPDVFFQALNFAGGFCAVILFGVFPALMVWIGRYRKKIPSDYKITGGQPLLVIILLFALFIVFYQVSIMSGFTIFPNPGS
jgi:tyrosine-specific transport protein